MKNYVKLTIGFTISLIKIKNSYKTNTVRHNYYKLQEYNFSFVLEIYICQKNLKLTTNKVRNGTNKMTSSHYFFIF